MKTLLKIITVIAALTFFVAACGIDSNHFTAIAITMVVSMGWIGLFLYANGREI